jgi:hypothetical protein
MKQSQNKMKKMKSKSGLLMLLVAVMFLQTSGLAQQDSTPATPVVKLHYYNINNSQQYLLLESNLKKGKVLTPQPEKKYQLFLDSTAAETMIATLQTDAAGKAKTFLPPGLKQTWDNKGTHLFILKEGEEELINDFSITKAKLTIDTSSSDGVKSITVTVQKQKEGEWIPAPEVEMKIGISRLGGILPAGDEATYTTDSSGSVTVEVKKDSLPGNAKGIIMLAASIEDNDELGNLQTEMAAVWGIPQKSDNSFFDKRTLWSTRTRTPFWLLAIAYTIVLTVWGTLIYLVKQLIKIKKLGKVKAV